MHSGIVLVEIRRGIFFHSGDDIETCCAMPVRVSRRDPEVNGDTFSLFNTSTVVDATGYDIKGPQN